jgi:hypothetical protein
MAHERDSLWDYARGGLAREDAERIAAHLALCGDCAQALDEVRTAQSVLHPAPVPALTAQRWHDVDARVLEAARRELTRPGWLAALRGLWGGVPVGAWAGALVAAAAAAFVLFGPSLSEPPVHPAVPPIAERAVAPAPLPALPEIQVPPHQVLISAARRARSAGKALSARTSVAEGSAVTTERQGELSLALPDGSRATLLSESEVKLEHASAQTVRLHVERGTLLVAASHRSERAFTVQAGELEVRVVGTRFLVERDDDGVGVAVHEGVVEAELGGKTQRVSAGQSVRFRAGTASTRGLSEEQRVELARLDPPAAVRSHPTVWERPDESDTPPIPDTDSGQSVPSVTPAPTQIAAPTEEAPPPVTAPPLLDARGPDAGPKPSSRVRPAPWPPIKLPLHVDSHITPVNMSPDEYHVRQLVILADQGEYELALERAEQWLRAADGGEAPRLRREVRQTQARCLRKLGREDEARAIEQAR